MRVFSVAVPDTVMFVKVPEFPVCAKQKDVTPKRNATTRENLVFIEDKRMAKTEGQFGELTGFYHLNKIVANIFPYYILSNAEHLLSYGSEKISTVTQLSHSIYFRAFLKGMPPDHLYSNTKWPPS